MFDNLLISNIKIKKANSQNTVKVLTLMIPFDAIFSFSGYMLNVVTGENFKFVPWGIGRSSYFISLLLMFLFVS